MQPTINNTSTSVLSNKVHIPINTITTTTLPKDERLSEAVTTTTPQPINTEEFAKLDALLEDLLAEVEQPILLNKQTETGYTSSSLNKTRNNNSVNFSSNINDIERSVDWLNEQKELLRSRKINQQQQQQQQQRMHDVEYIDDNSQIDQQQQPYRKIKSKLDYYLSSSNNNGTSPSISFSSGSGNSTSKQPYLINNDENNNNTSTQHQSVQHHHHHHHHSHLMNNKPPVSPNTRMMYSPTSQLMQQQQQTILLQPQPQQQQQQTSTATFRSLSTNPTLVKNVHDLEDESKIIDGMEFDRYSQRSFRSNTSTVQRTKYHTVSNDYVECTRPAAPTPVPPVTTTSASSRQQNYQSKRALSAPPTEIGKVVLQRMELKSPLTVRQTSTIPFEHESYIQNQPMPTTTSTTTSTSTVLPIKTMNNGAQYIDNPYNNRGILKSQTYSANNQQQQQQLFEPTSTLQQPLPQTTRNVFLNRSYSEAPNKFTNGYETDSGLITNNGYTTSNSYRTTTPSSVSYRLAPADNQTTPIQRHTHAYRTLGPSTATRYQLLNDQSGYDTDTGLIKLRHVLDNRRASSRNGAPLQYVQQQQQQTTSTTPNGYYYHQSRSITPSLSQYSNAFNSNSSNRFNSQSNVQIPINDSRFQDERHLSSPFIVGSYPVTADMPYMDQNSTELIQQPHHVQILDANGNVTTSVPAYLTPDGRQVILQEIEPTPLIVDYNGTHAATSNLNTLDSRQSYLPQPPPPPPSQQPKSVIVSQKVAPSAYQTPNTNAQSSAFHSANNNINTTTSNGNLAQLNRDTSITTTRLATTSSATNLSSSQLQKQQQQQQQQQAQQLNRDGAGSVTSLPDSNEILRNYPKSVKSTQVFWYKPKISRDEAIALLKDKAPGTFLIRDSNNFPGAYGLALKVDKPPANVQIKPGSDPTHELVRHFLIEPTTKGVRIKGCINEPIFGNLAALVYQHSLTPLALPIKLILPTQDLTTYNSISEQNGKVNGNSELTSNTKANSQSIQSTSQTVASPQLQQQNSSSAQISDARVLLEKGAACNVFFLNTINVENRNGLEAISYALSNTKALSSKDASQLLLIQFKVTAQGVTLTDLNKKKFIRQHFATNTVIYCAVEEKITWPLKIEKINKPRIFGLICKPKVTTGTNECHLFVELDPDQPAIAIVDFINRYLIPSKS